MEHGFGRHAVAVGRRGTDRYRDEMLAFEQLDRLADMPTEVVADGHDGLGALDPLEEDDEFVPPDAPRDAVVRSDCGRDALEPVVDPLGDRDEQVITDAVSHRVIDVFEIVEIKEQDRERRTRVAFGDAQTVFDALDEQRPVGEPGEVIVERLMAEPFLGALPLLRFALQAVDGGPQTVSVRLSSERRATFLCERVRDLDRLDRPWPDRRWPALADQGSPAGALRGWLDSAKFTISPQSSSGLTRGSIP